MAAHDLRCERDLAPAQLRPRSKDRKAPRIKAEAASVQLHDRFLPRPEPRERPLAVRFFPLKDALEYPLAYALRYRSVRALHIHAARRVRNQQHREIPAVAQAEFRPARQIWFALRRAEERFLIRDIFRKQQPRGCDASGVSELWQRERDPAAAARDAPALLRPAEWPVSNTVLCSCPERERREGCGLAVLLFHGEARFRARRRTG